MIVEMKKLNLVAMSYDRENVLNALQRTAAAEVTCHSPCEAATALPFTGEELRARCITVEAALDALTSEAEKYRKEQTKEKQTQKDGFEVSYTEFMSAGEKAADMDALVAEVNALLDEATKLKVEIVKEERTAETTLIYSKLTAPFQTFSGTRTTRSYLGTIPASREADFIKAVEENELFASKTLPSTGGLLVCLTAHKTAADAAETTLQQLGFTPCPFTGEQSGAALHAFVISKIEEKKSRLAEIGKRFYELYAGARDLKIYCDYLAFGLEKEELNEKLLATEHTFMLEAYVPVEKTQDVEAELNALQGGAVYFEFSDVAEDEDPPTMYKNNALVRNFEAITDMYSPPAAREFDPNTIMAIFYSLFLGFIMADIGYGLLMVMGGIFLLMKIKRDGMVRRLGGVFAVGGVCTVIWGFLFNSFFGFALLPFKVMPDLQGTEMSWSLAGINVPALLVISMLLGVVQLAAGYVCRAVQCWRRGQILDGIFDGLVWAVFSVGVELAIVGFVQEFNLSVLGMAGGIIAGASLLVAVLTAGRKEKFLGKFTKGFGAAYGVINYASDILSYARLYGLMLAGAVIADIISSNSVNLIASGNVAFIILGVLILLIGHIFNLAIGLLGAYIHDARLQYVEFYGRFY
ncbi:MAG: hypothetical protein NC131_20335, partial [Roseburia sp.]|nr:hypothetical protein [Roseburia sp.]